MRIIVKNKDGYFYNCKNTLRGYRCGKCGKGIIRSWKGYKCKICSSIVAQIIFDDEFVREVHEVKAHV